MPIVSSFTADKDKLAVGFEDDIQSIVIWFKKWIVNVKASKIKLLSFTHLIGQLLPSISTADVNLQESNTLRHLTLIFYTDRK